MSQPSFRNIYNNDNLNVLKYNTLIVLRLYYNVQLSTELDLKCILLRCSID